MNFKTDIILYLLSDMKPNVLKNKFTAFFALTLFLGFSAFSQNKTLYPGTKAEALQDSLVKDYKASKVLDYNNARDALWGAVAGHNNEQLEGVYTGYTITINSSASNPRTEAYNKGINCEHTWPKSKGASSGYAKSDMHHLFPTREEANSTRSSYPFADIDDNQTDKWFYKDKILTSKPTTNIDAYSEYESKGYFEPREEHKGNVARAMFYFYTMYKSQADKSFFLQQKDVLYKWHVQDPVDAEEIWRNEFIASKQGNLNPFILDSSLILRAYFPEFVNENILKVSPGEYTVYSGADTTLILEVNTNAASWEVTCDENWVSIKSDFSKKQIIVSLDKNDTEKKRQAFILVKANGIEQIVSVIQLSVGNTTPILESESLSRFFKVYPNPFNEKISFTFDISQPSNVQILIFNGNGQIVKTHFNFYPEPGTFEFDFETNDMEPGYYYYNFILNDSEKRGEIILAE